MDKHISYNVNYDQNSFHARYKKQLLFTFNDIFSNKKLKKIIYALQLNYLFLQYIPVAPSDLGYFSLVTRNQFPLELNKYKLIMVIVKIFPHIPCWAV